MKSITEERKEHERKAQMLAALQQLEDVCEAGDMDFVFVMSCAPRSGERILETWHQTNAPFEEIRKHVWNRRLTVREVLATELNKHLDQMRQAIYANQEEL